MTPTVKFKLLYWEDFKKAQTLFIVFIYVCSSVVRAVSLPASGMQPGTNCSCYTLTRKTRSKRHCVPDYIPIVIVRNCSPDNLRTHP
jgi:hypothetical protein